MTDNLEEPNGSQFVYFNIIGLAYVSTISLTQALICRLCLYETV